MGAYLSRPNTTKESEDQQNKKLVYGVSSMQGWRVAQEDAHNCILDFDEETALFGVYDGHGGAEVAIYTSEKLPEFIKDNKEYKNGDYEKALISAFLEFDDTLTSNTALKRLNEIIQTNKDDEYDEENEESGSGTILFTDRPQCSHSSEDGDDDDDDDADYEYGEGDPETETPDSLRRDASRPLEEVMASYIPRVNKHIAGERGIKPASPYLRGRRDGAGGSGECGSSYAGECSTSFVEPGPSSSNECSSSSSNSRTDKTEVNGSEDTEAETSVNGEPEPDSSKDVSDQPSKESSSNSKDESSTNGTAESSINGSTNVNGNITEEVEASSKESSAKESTSNCDEKPSCSSPSKKKKLALTDLDDSDVVKNFITNEEIDEDDEDDSEDETFEVDEDAESDSDEDDSSYPESLLTKLKRRLCQVAMQAEGIDDDEDDDDDDDDDDENDKDHTRSSELDEEAEEEGEEEEGEDDFEDDDSDDESIDLFGDSSNAPGVRSGCTAVVALIKNDTLYVANAGDSRCVICKDGKAVDMSEDHKPKDNLERLRIEKAGGEVEYDGHDHRVNGRLNLSRAIGDHEFKRNTELSNKEQMITAFPDVRMCKLEPDVEFIVLACDGIWNSKTSQEVVNFIRPKIQSYQKLSTICEELFDALLAPNKWGDDAGCDNMTCIIVKIRHDNDKITAELDSKQTTVSDDGETDSKETDICKNVKVDSTSAEVLKSADSSKKEDDDKKDEAVPSQENSEAQPVSETEEPSSSSTSLKRSVDSTEEDECQAKRPKTDMNVDSS